MHLGRRLCAAALALLLPFGAIALAPGEAPPPLQAPRLDGSTLALESLRGQVVYVDFWASWCAPCLQALPALDVLQRRYAEQGFTVVGVNVDTDRAAALRMLKRVAVGFTIVFDPQGRWPEAFALKAMPSGYLLDRDGVVRFVKAGYMAKDLPQIEAAVQRELVRGTGDDHASDLGRETVAPDGVAGSAGL
jgi:thiol-disulfide isomerase/thioredoxin